MILGWRMAPVDDDIHSIRGHFFAFDVAHRGCCDFATGRDEPGTPELLAYIQSRQHHVGVLWLFEKLSFRRLSPDTVVCVCSRGSCWLMTGPSPYNLKKDYAGSLVTRTWLSSPWCDYGRHTLS